MYAGASWSAPIGATLFYRLPPSVHRGPAGLPAGRTAASGRLRPDPRHAAEPDPAARRAARSIPRCPYAFDRCRSGGAAAAAGRRRPRAPVGLLAAARPGRRRAAAREHAGTPAWRPERWPARALLELDDVRKWFPLGVPAGSCGTAHREHVRAVDGVSLQRPDRRDARARRRDRLRQVDAGALHDPAARRHRPAGCCFDGNRHHQTSRRDLRPLRRDMQMIFQDPYGSLNPRRRVGSIIGDPFAIHGSRQRRPSGGVACRS